MCGIAGMFDLKGKADFDVGLLSRMNDAQIHRGPDEEGVFLEPGIGLAHRRLSIIDLAAGQQPMHSADGNTVVVYNGEIYNFFELSQDLTKMGYRFQTRCDTEVILYAWQEWGEACVEKFRGMFAFAVYDRRKQSLFLARDRLGIKPLFFTILNGETVIFGSELKVLKSHPDLPRKLDSFALEDYFALGYIPEPRTIYHNIFKLMPGHTISFISGAEPGKQRQYWDVPFSSTINRASDHDVSAEFMDRFREAVDIRLIADVPLGAFLSGGVDSSAVVATMAQLQEEAVNTCAIGFDVRQFDETRFAREVAEQYQTNHYERVVTSENFDLIDKLARLYDEPYADSSAIPTYLVCELARERVTVALSGDGGDENFAGYRRYRWHMNEERMRGSLPLGFRQTLFGPLGQIYPKLDWAPRFLRAKTTFESLAKNAVSAYFHSVSLTSDTQRRSLFSPDLTKELQGYRAVETFENHARKCPSDDPLSLIQYLDMKTYLVGDILTKVDRASMAHSLEVRVPFLDHKLVEWVSGMPSNMKLKGQEGKYILKKSFEPYLSRDILYRDKMGFGVPLGKWFRGPLRQRLRDSLLEGGLADTGLFNADFLKQLVDDHQSGRREYSAPLWSLLMFQAATAHDDFSLA